MTDVITYKDILAARECMERNDVLGFEDGTTVIHNRLLLQACNHDEWQDKRIKELQAQVESDQMMLDIRDTQLRIAKEKLEEQYAFATKCVNKISFYRAALDKLARLGNEPHYGNSDGNCIARKALEQSDGKDTQTHTENTQ